MSNKFSKSIDDRRRQEALHLKSSPPPADIPTDSASASGEGTDSVPVGIASDRLPIFLGDISRRRAKGKTFYLDDDLIKAIKQSSESAGVAESRIVNEILRRAFGL